MLLTFNKSEHDLLFNHLVSKVHFTGIKSNNVLCHVVYLNAECATIKLEVGALHTLGPSRAAVFQTAPFLPPNSAVDERESQQSRVINK